MHFQRHEKRVVGQPVHVFAGEVFHRLHVPPRGALKRGAQHREAVFPQPSVIHARGVCAPVHVLHLAASEKALPDKEVEVYQIWIPRESGKGLIGRVAAACVAKRQYFPIALARCGEKIHKVVRRLTQSADAVP